METQRKPIKKKDGFRRRIANAIIVMFGGTPKLGNVDEIMEKYMSQAKELMATNQREDDAGMNDKYLFDFKAGYVGEAGVGAGWNEFPRHGIPTDDRGNSNSNDVDPPTEKIAITPKEVLEELEVMPTPFSLALLDEKISIMEDKIDMIRQEYAKREVEALKERLENRKKYPEFKPYFDKFQNTDDEKIDKFLKKHGFVMKTSDIFIPEFPDDAIRIMTEYTEKMEDVCDKKPIFYVIAEEDKFRKAYEKRDPILLAQSPFGFYWQILGAWDEEMLLLHEL